MNSPVCNSNGTVDDNGSEIAMADSENLSNNEGSAIESDHKSEQPDFLSGSFEGLELFRRLNFQAKTAVVRKKRNSGRKRAQNDGLESTSKSDPEVNNETGVLKDTLALQASCGNLIDSQPKDESDEHLPLVKRARVRMGKMLAEEHQKLDFLEKTEQKLVDFVSTSSSNLASTSSQCDESHQANNLSIVNELLVSVPVDNHGGIAEDKPQSLKTENCVVNESVACSPVDNGIYIPGDKPQPWKTKASSPLGCVIDGEAALPPSKRLHRALEAMSANAAEESQPPMAVSLSTKTGVDIDESDLHQIEIHSDMPVNAKVDNNLESHYDFLNCNNSLRCSPSRYDVVAKSFQEVSMSDSADRVSVEKADLKDNVKGPAVCSENKELFLSKNTGVPDNVPPVQAILSNVTDSKPLQSLATSLTQLPLEVLSNVKEVEMVQAEATCEKPDDKLHSVIGKEKDVNVRCSNSIFNLCTEDVRILAPNENLKAPVDSTTEVRHM